MKKTENSKKKIDIKILITITIIIVGIAIQMSLAKYSSYASGYSGIKVAKFEIELIPSEKELVKKLIPLNSDNNLELEFEVSNLSDVSVSYNIEINTANNLPLKLELYKFDDEAGKYSQKIPLNLNMTDEIEKGINEEADKYKLKIQWNTEASNYNDYKYRKTIDYVQIVTDCKQID